MVNNGEQDGSIHEASDQNNTTEQYQVSIYSYFRCSLLGCQALVPVLMNLIHFPLALLALLCLLPDETFRGHFIFALFLGSGVATIIQAAVGIKFPVMMSPSTVFISGTIIFLKSPLWEMLSAGDMYAMGPSLRHEEYTVRTRELRGVIILSGFVSSIICGILWYLPIKLPSTTISATLLSVSLSNVCHVQGEMETSMLTLLAYILSLIFYVVENLKIPFLHEINNDDSQVTFKVFKQFSVLFPFVILVAVNTQIEQGNNSLLERGIGFHHWYSFNLPFKGFTLTLPKFSSRSLVLLPVFCCQFIISYCCYQAISKDKERHLKALFIETLFVVICACIGIPIPITIDPTSIGLIHVTKLKNTESSVIAGGLLILFSILIKMAAMLSYASYSLLSGLNAFLYGQLFCKGLSEMKKEKTDSTSIVAISVLSGMVFSSFPEGIGTNLFYSIIGVIFSCSTVVTFFVSIMLSVVYRSSNPENKYEF